MARHLSGCVALLAVALAVVSCQSPGPTASRPPTPRNGTAAAPAPAVNPPAAPATPAPTERPAKPPPIREFDLDTLARLGREIYRQDQLAWHATDAVASALGLDALGADAPRGWVVDVSGHEPLVRFLRGTATGVEASVDVRFPATGAPVVEKPSDRRLTPGQLLRHQAVNAGRQALVDGHHPLWRGRGSYNTVVLDDPAGSGFLVYFLRPKLENAVIPVGGHYRISVSADGRTVTQVDRLFASFLTFDRRQMPADGTLVEAVMSHVVSDTPIETHVFLSLQDHIPFLVMTRDGRAWEVSDGTIKLSKIQLPADAAPPPAR